VGGVTDSDLNEFWVEYAVGDKPLDDDFKQIGKANQVVASGLLAEWDTKSLPENLYTIRLGAIDKLEHTKDYSITVTLDNTPPVARLIAPLDGSRLTKRTEIKAEVSDEHLDGYVLEYTTESEPNTTLWRQIFKTPESLTETEVSINHQWEVPTITGTIFIRLTAIDAASNTAPQLISVEVPEAVTKGRGGDVTSQDGDASIYVPPRSLPEDEIITINPVSEQEREAHPGWEAAYDFEPFDCSFGGLTPERNNIKPATITIRYPTGLPEAGKALIIYRFKKQESDGKVTWTAPERLGGTFDGSSHTIKLAVTRLGRFVVMQEVQSAFSASAKIAYLTCQPRIFSPKGSGYSKTTTISFILEKSANVTVKIFNRAGELVRIIADDVPMNAGTNAITWDGKDCDNKVVPSNLYIIAVIAGIEMVTKTVVVANR